MKRVKLFFLWTVCNAFLRSECQQGSPWQKVLPEARVKDFTTVAFLLLFLLDFSWCHWLNWEDYFILNHRQIEIFGQLELGAGFDFHYQLCYWLDFVCVHNRILLFCWTLILHVDTFISIIRKIAEYTENFTGETELLVPWETKLSFFFFRYPLRSISQF